MGCLVLCKGCDLKIKRLGLSFVGMKEKKHLIQVSVGVCAVG